MNWVGGVKRRLILKKEERRRQEQYFASYSSRGRNSKRVRIDTRTETTNNNEEQKFQQTPAECLSHSADPIGSKSNPQESSTKRLSGRKGLHLTRRLKLSSIHGPFSEMLLRMEIDGVKRQQKRKAKELLNPAVFSCHPGTSRAYSSSSSGLKETFPRQKVKKNNISFSSDDKVKSLLANAPKYRKVLTLSPTRRKGITWTELNIPKMRHIPPKKPTNKQPEKCNSRLDESSSSNMIPNSSFDKRRIEELIGHVETSKDNKKVSNPNISRNSEDKNNKSKFRDNCNVNDQTYPLKTKIVKRKLDKKRQITYIDSGLQCLKNRKDKTPYMERNSLAQTPLRKTPLGGISSGSTKSSLTPSDVTLQSLFQKDKSDAETLESSAVPIPEEIILSSDDEDPIPQSKSLKICPPEELGRTLYQENSLMDPVALTSRTVFQSNSSSEVIENQQSPSDGSDVEEMSVASSSPMSKKEYRGDVYRDRFLQYSSQESNEISHCSYEYDY